MGNKTGFSSVSQCQVCMGYGTSLYKTVLSASEWDCFEKLGCASSESFSLPPELLGEGANPSDLHRKFTIVLGATPKPLENHSPET